MLSLGSMLQLPLILALLPSLISAQQYEGEVIPNSLPAVDGSELAYFKITDPKGSDANLTLTNYMALNSAGQRVEGAGVKRAVIIIHGSVRDPDIYIANMLAAIADVTNSDVDIDSVALCSPYFPNGQDKNFGYPWTEGLSNGAGSTSSALVWSGAAWSDGGDNQYPHDTQTVSSYEAMDQLLRYFDDSSIFPDMNQIVVAGHSLGAQYVQRYAAVGNELGLETPISYWVGNPNSLVWFDESRPLDVSECDDYDEWRDGFTNYNESNTYGQEIVAQGREAVLARYNSRSVAYGRGLQDLGDTSSTCGPETTGANRNERFFNFIAAFPPSCPEPVGGPCSTIDYVQTGHDAGVMFSSTAGLTRLFLDNFNGTGEFGYDIGYPRRQTGDDPYPDPAFNSTTSEDTTVYAGNMTYAGCYTDIEPRSLGYQAYSQSNNTVDLCTSTCDELGYEIAGMEFGLECWCGHYLTARAEQVVNTGCSDTCAGNSSQYCGAGSRLSIYAADGTPTQLAAPVGPATIGAFTYEGCKTEATTGRAFSDDSLTSDDMTLEKCAEFCVGYNYFGTEYATQCYCGNTINEGAVFITRAECSMTCAGNNQEPCGGSARVTWYADESKVTVE